MYKGFLEIWQGFSNFNGMDFNKLLTKLLGMVIQITNPKSKNSLFFSQYSENRDCNFECGFRDSCKNPQPVKRSIFVNKTKNIHLNSSK